MLTCIACTKQIGGSLRPEPEPEDDDGATTPSTRQAIRSLTSQIKDMAVKASGAYRHCKPCSAGSGRFECAYERAASCNGFAGGEVSPTTSEAAADEEEEREWVAQVEPGVLITFVSLSNGGNDIKRIRFSREMFNRWQAQRWWAENYDKVMELYNVDRFSRHTVPLPGTPVPEEDENSKLRRSPEDNPATPPPSSERLHRPTSKLSNKTQETSSVEVNSRRTSSSSSEDRSNGDISASVSNASDLDREWVEQDQPGVYITIHALPGGARELRRVRFSRERFSEMHARLWWEENRARIHQQYL